MNKFNPRKLLNSKWTAVNPQNKEKHFVVTKLTTGESGDIEDCLIEAVYSGREESIDWISLRNSTLWKQGWL